VMGGYAGRRHDPGTNVMDAADLELEPCLSFDDRARFMAAALDALEHCGDVLRVDCSALVHFDDEGVALLLALGRYAEGIGVRVELIEAPLALRYAVETRGSGSLFTWAPLAPWASLSKHTTERLDIP